MLVTAGPISGTTRRRLLGKDPTVQVGAVEGGFEANTDVTSGVITIAPTTDCCAAAASLFFELTNAKSSKRHLANYADAAAGNLAREDFAKTEAKVEYEGVVLLRDNFAKCRAKWGCSATATSGYENVSNDFDTYYESQTEKYKDYYRDAWDSSYKAASMQNILRRRDLIGVTLVSAVRANAGRAVWKRSYFLMANLRDEIKSGAPELSFRVGAAEWKLVKIPAGSFTMGTPVNEPGRESWELASRRFGLQNPST